VGAGISPLRIGEAPAFQIEPLSEGNCAASVFTIAILRQRPVTPHQPETRERIAARLGDCIKMNTVSY
jgi:hypothetical protein